MLREPGMKHVFVGQSTRFFEPMIRQRADYDDWARHGAEGWGYREVLPYFIRSETNQRGASAWHGDSGPLKVSDIDSGRTRDKVDFVDPAAAPLGTDAEAGGNVPQPEKVAAEANAIAPPKQGWLAPVASPARKPAR